jgi:hypothetical protein
MTHSISIKGRYAECHYAECRYAECPGAVSAHLQMTLIPQMLIGTLYFYLFAHTFFFSHKIVKFSSKRQFFHQLLN